MIDRSELIEVVTRQVLATLAGATPSRDWNTPPRWSPTAPTESATAATAPTCRSGLLAVHRSHAAATRRLAADNRRLCDEAAEYSFAAVCINPCWVARASRRLRGSGVTVASVVGFPARRQHPGDQGHGGAAGAARRRPGNRHGDQRRAPSRAASHDLVQKRHRRSLRCLPRSRRTQQGHHRNRLSDRRGKGDCVPPRQGGLAPTTSRPPPASGRGEPPSSMWR